MARLPRIDRTSWLHGVAVAAVMIVACAGPGTLNPGGGAGGKGGRGGTGGRGGIGGNIIIIHPTSLSLDSGIAGTTGQEPSDVDGGINCGVTTGSLTRQPADLLVVLDRSGSMEYGIDTNYNCNAGDPNCTQRWATVTTALNQVLSNSPDGVEWGLKFFSSPGGRNVCTVDPGVEVEIPASAADVQAAIAAARPGNQTPTKAAIQAAVAYFNTLDDGRAHYILLATDGQPNCDPGTSSSTTAVAAANTQAAIAAAAAAGIKTYVVGIGPATGNLDNFAEAGGTERHFPATSPDELTTALGAIVTAVASCTFALDPKAPPPVDPDNVVVEFDGDRNLRAPRDPTHTEGWDYTSPALTAIEIYGSWCENVVNETYTSVKILIGCPNQPIP